MDLRKELEKLKAHCEHQLGLMCGGAFRHDRARIELKAIVKKIDYVLSGGDYVDPDVLTPEQKAAAEKHAKEKAAKIADMRADAMKRQLAAQEFKDNGKKKEGD